MRQRYLLSTKNSGVIIIVNSQNGRIRSTRKNSGLNMKFKTNLLLQKLAKISQDLKLKSGLISCFQFSRLWL